jgi:hypothetical protein
MNTLGRMTNLFRQIPPWTLVLQILSKLRISTEFPCTFQKQDIYLNDSIELVGLLEPYYIPCKAKQFLAYTDATRWIVILRHLLQPHGYILVIQETTRNTKKAIFYTIERVKGTLKEAFQMDFS